MSEHSCGRSLASTDYHIRDTLTASLTQNRHILNQRLPLSDSFDFITREISLGETDCFFIGVNGMCDIVTLQRVLSDLQDPEFIGSPGIRDLPAFVKDKFSYVQVSMTDSFDTICHNVLCGPCVLLFEGFDRALLVDVRKYPSRSIQTPETERVLRGARDGFVETLLTNTNLLRRRLRIPGLTFALHTVGTNSRTDVAVAYIRDNCDRQLLSHLNRKLDSLQASELTMGIQSLKELLLKKSFLHPMPAFFLTERPDVACSYLTEGHILVFVDNSPFAMVVPCTVFQFTQSPEDYYKAPLIGTYQRLVRFLCLLGSLLIMPLFLYLSLHPGLLPAGFESLIPQGISPLAVFIYVLFVEFGLDVFKYASAHAAGNYSGAFAIVGGLIIGDMATQLQWASPEVIFYGAATLLASLGISSIELADAIKLYRFFLILITGFFPDFGLLWGLILILLSVLTTPVFYRKSYFWPLFPFCLKGLKTLLFRYPTYRAQPERKGTMDTTDNMDMEKEP
ncbi:MAG: spore germination protein [Lachnospiraceae bacterium]|nr:spore germination protein [Lachnospiraceae bacterium]